MKPLVFVNTQIRVDKVPELVDSWELVAFSPCPVMHAAWNPVNQMLVCQLDSVKESFVDYPVRNTKTSKVDMQERRVDQYYRITLSDKEAIKFILENYVANFTDQEWEIQFDVSAIPSQEII